MSIFLCQLKQRVSISKKLPRVGKIDVQLPVLLEKLDNRESKILVPVGHS